MALNMRIKRQRTDVNEIGSLVEGFSVEYPLPDLIKVLYEKGGLGLEMTDLANMALHTAASVAIFSSGTRGPACGRFRRRNEVRCALFVPPFG